MHPPPSTNQKKPQDLFLVCGLQSLGQHCVAVLKEYDVKVSAIDDEQSEHWEVPEVPSLLEMPWYDVKLYAGDRLIVLATSSSLQRIEWGEMLPRLWQVQIEKALTTNAIMYGAQEIVLITGCSSASARQWMNNLPGVLPIPLYKHQAQRLVRELTKIQVLANVIFIGQGSSLT